MFRFIKDLIFAWQYKRAVKKAVKLSKLHGMKFYVVYLKHTHAGQYAHAFFSG